MAEFCLECFNKINNANLKKRDVTLSKYPTLCEECGEIKPVIIRIWERHIVDRYLDAFRKK